MSATHTNRLSKETSPYLLQHQHNPVDWYAWGDEAFAAAREQNKPIFLSVGYSTCYWCHVMERQCFENEAIASMMNERFINIKVDREERPDVDQLYMTALQVITRHGGWPMSMWLLPDLRPYFAGTYFPPDELHGRPGFPDVLTALANAFQEQIPELEKTASQIENVLKDLAQPSGTDEALTIAADWIEPLIVRSLSDYESTHGGFGGAPKFPRQTLLELLLHAKQSPLITADLKQEIDKPLRHALDAMANGGIRDQLGGAFHRYSVDAQWLVPHFEIMLYDNAMLGWIYAEASRVLNEPRYAQVARGIFDFVLSEMTSPDGAFYTAFDAEVDAREGLNYLWTMSQVEEVLTPREAAQFAAVYGLDKGPNFGDPHHSLGPPDQNVLYLAQPQRENDPAIADMRQRLYEHRQKRNKPLLDTKVITGWNGLMIRALAHAGKVLGEARYMQAATRAADFLTREHWIPERGLIRTSRDGVKKYDGLLDDYAFFAQALTELGRSDDVYTLINIMRDLFEDTKHGGFYFSPSNATDLLVRQKVGADSPLPAGNAVAATACVSVGFGETAAKSIAAFAMQTNHHAQSMSSTLLAMLKFIEGNGPLRIEPVLENETARLASPQELAEQAVNVLWELASPDQIKLELRIGTGFHLSADKLEITSPDSALADVALPAPIEKQYAYADGPIKIYEGSIAATVRLHQPLGDDESLTLRVGFQPCTEQACLPPAQRLVTITK